MAPHYDGATDTILVAEGDIDQGYYADVVVCVHEFNLTKAIQEAIGDPSKVPSCIKQIDKPSAMVGVCAIHKDSNAGTYYILGSSGYYVYSRDKDSGEEELFGEVLYAQIEGIP